MSLIEKMRSSTDSLWMKVLLFAVVGSFIAVGGKSAKGRGGSVVATVNGDNITTKSFDDLRRQAYRRAEGGLDEAKRVEIENQVLEQLITVQAELQAAEEAGLAVHDDEVKRAIVKIEAFHQDGKFSQAKYEEVLATSGQDRVDFEASMHKQLLLDKLHDLVARSAVVSDAEVKAEWAREETSLTVEYVRLLPEAFLPGIAVPDAEVDSYLAANRDRVKAKYDEDYARLYNLPRRYRLHSILVGTTSPGVDVELARARAEGIAADAAKGAPFEDLARQWSDDPSGADGGDMGLVAADVLDPALRAAADAAGPGKVSGVVQTSKGFTILRVDTIEEARTTTLEEAEREIALRLVRESRVRDTVNGFATQLVSAWSASGVLPVELVGPLGLPTGTSEPVSLLDSEVPGLGPSPELFTALATAKAGDVLPLPVSINGVGHVVRVASRTAPDPATFAEGSTRVRARLEFVRRAEIVAAWRKDLVAQAKVERFLDG